MPPPELLLDEELLLEELTEDGEELLEGDELAEDEDEVLEDEDEVMEDDVLRDDELLEDDNELVEDDELLLEALLLPPEDDEDPLPLEDDGVDELLEPLTLPALLLELVLLPECELLLSELDALLKLLDAPKLLGELLPLDDEKWLELTLLVDDELLPFSPTPPPPSLAGLLPPQAAVQRPNPTMPTRYREIVRVLISREAFHSVECRG